MADPWDDLRFWSQIIEDSRRTIMCSPDLESRVKCHLDALGVGGLHEVIASPMVPDGQIYVMDQQAIEASTAEMIQHTRRRGVDGG